MFLPNCIIHVNNCSDGTDNFVSPQKSVSDMGGLKCFLLFQTSQSTRSKPFYLNEGKQHSHRFATTS